MKIVGVGCGPGMLTEEAVFALKGAQRVYGSRRAIDLARHALSRSCEIHEIREFSSLELPEDAVLLSTGDPMLAGLGNRGGEVIPGISSLQLAFARLRLPLAKVAVVDGHGRDPGAAITETVEEVRRGEDRLHPPGSSLPARRSRRRPRERGDHLSRGAPFPPGRFRLRLEGPQPPGTGGAAARLLLPAGPGILHHRPLRGPGLPGRADHRGTSSQPPVIASRLFSLVIGGPDDHKFM